MGYTRRKIRGINRSFLLAGMALAGWALSCAWLGWPRGLRHGSAAGFGLFAFAALFFLAFPAIWARYPAKHPVNHALMRYGDLREISERLDREMNGSVERLGPFLFTASMLVYDSGHEFQMIPYDQIVSAEIVGSDDAPALKVKTRGGKRYQWYRTWMQGRFNPEEVLRAIHSRAHLEDPAASTEEATARPSSAAESPSAEG